jgi:hypothetical protein
MKPETDNLTRLKMWAMAVAIRGNPAVRRRAMYRYLGELYTLAMRDHPSLRPLASGEGGMVMVRAMAEIQEALTQASNREVPALFRDVFKVIGTGRRPTARAELLCWAYASAVITGLMKQHGKSKKEAAQLVEKHLRSKKIDVPTTGKGDAPAWKRLCFWRDECMAGRKGKVADGYYRDALHYTGVRMTPQELMDDLLDPPFVSYDPLD